MFIRLQKSIKIVNKLSGIKCFEAKKACPSAVERSSNIKHLKIIMQNAITQEPSARAPLGTPPARGRPGRTRTRSPLRSSLFGGGPIGAVHDVVRAAAAVVAAADAAVFFFFFFVAAVVVGAVVVGVVLVVVSLS